MITLVGGNFQDTTGNPVKFGSIRMELNCDATIIAPPYGIIPGVAGNPVTFQLDANGDILPNAPAAAAQVYSNLELQPQNSVGLGTYYLVTIYSQNGARLSNPMWWQFQNAAGATVNISSMTAYMTAGGNVIFYPVFTNVTFNSPIVVQTINSGLQTGNYSPVGFVVPVDGFYLASAFINSPSNINGATTEMRVTFDDGDESPDANDYWFNDTTWDGVAGNWDAFRPIFWAIAGSTIAFTVVKTGTITYQVYYRLEQVDSQITVLRGS